MNPPPIIELKDLHRRYGKLDAVNGLSLRVQPGRCYGYGGLVVRAKVLYLDGVETLAGTAAVQRGDMRNGIHSITSWWKGRRKKSAVVQCREFQIGRLVEAPPRHRERVTPT